MKREFLTELGLAAEQVDKIMAEHGKTVNSLKEEADKAKELEAQIGDYKTQLSERDNQLKDLEKKAAGNEELTKQIQEWKDKNDQTAQEYQAKLDKQAFDFGLVRKLKDEYGAKNPKAVRALLDLDKIKKDGDNFIGLDEQVKKLKESEDYLFGEKPFIKGRNPNPTPTPPNPNKKFGDMTSEERMELKEKDPDLYKRMRAEYLNKN